MKYVGNTSGQLDIMNRAAHEEEIAEIRQDILDVSTAVETEAERAKDAEGDIIETIEGMDLPLTTGDYIVSMSQTDGTVSASTGTSAKPVNSTAYPDVNLTSKGYVDEKVGQAIAGGMHYRGTTAVLPTSGVESGDMYKMSADSQAGSPVEFKEGDVCIYYNDGTSAHWDVIPAGDDIAFTGVTVGSVTIIDPTLGGTVNFAADGTLLSVTSDTTTKTVTYGPQEKLTDAVAAAESAVQTVTGSTLVGASKTNTTVTLSDSSKLTNAVALAETAVQGAQGDGVLIDASVDNKTTKVAPTNKLTTAVASAESALQSISKGTDGTYVTTTVGAKSNNSQTVGVSVTTKDISSATSSSDGLATAYNTKSYIDTSISNAISTEVSDRNTAITNAINALDVSTVSGDYIISVGETDGKVSATTGTKVGVKVDGTTAIYGLAGTTANQDLASVSKLTEEATARATADTSIMNIIGDPDDMYIEDTLVSAINDLNTRTSGAVTEVTGDNVYIETSQSGTTVTVSGTTDLGNAVTKANSAVQGVTHGTDGSYVTTTIGTKTSSNEQSVGVAVTTQDVSTATSSSNGLATALSSKNYTDYKAGEEASARDTAITNAINALDTSTVSGDYIVSVGETDGKVSATTGTKVGVSVDGSSNKIYGLAGTTANQDLASVSKVNAVKSDLEAADTAIRGDMGDLDDLETTDKTSIVAAINEVNSLSTESISSITGDQYINASVSGHAATIGATTDLTTAIDNANSALQSISKGTDGTYVTTTVSSKGTGTSQTVGVSVTTHAVSTATSSSDGLATANDVKTYTDGAINDAIEDEVDARDAAIAAAIGDLDVTGVGGDSSYISSISETDGKISATAKSSVSVSVDGTANKIYGLNGTATGQDLASTTYVTNAINALDVNLISGDYITKIVETDGKIDASVGTAQGATDTTHFTGTQLTTKGYVDEMVAGAIAGGVHYKGAIAVLPTSGMQNGDFYKMSADSPSGATPAYKTGDVCIYYDNGTTARWDVIPCGDDVEYTGIKAGSTSVISPTTGGTVTFDTDGTLLTYDVSNATITYKPTSALTDAVANANSAVQSASGDNYINASVSSNNVAVTATTKLSDAVASAETALQTITKGTDGTYVTTTVSTKSGNNQNIGVAVTTHDVSTATATDNGLAVANDVRTYVNAVDTSLSTALANEITDRTNADAAEVTARNAAITAAIEALDSSTFGGTGSYITTISETDGKISATAASRVGISVDGSANKIYGLEGTDASMNLASKSYVDNAVVDVSTKADKVQGMTELTIGDLAALDEDGNLIDSTYSFNNPQSSTDTTVVTTVVDVVEAGNGNAVSSNAVYAALTEQSSVVYEGTTATVTAQPGFYYKWDTMDTLSITINNQTSDKLGLVYEYMFEFKSGSTPTTLSINAGNGVTWANGQNPNIHAGHTYQISITNSTSSDGGNNNEYYGVIVEF